MSQYVSPRKNSQLFKLMIEKSKELTALYDSHLIQAGDTVRITRSGFKDALVTYETELFASHGSRDLYDALRLKVKFYHTSYLDDTITNLTVVKRKERHHFFTPKLDRAPVVGDFFNRGGGLYLVVPDTKTAETVAGIHFVNVSTAVKQDTEDGDSWGTTRKLIRDGETGKLV